MSYPRSESKQISAEKAVVPLCMLSVQLSQVFQKREWPELVSVTAAGRHPVGLHCVQLAAQAGLGASSTHAWTGVAAETMESNEKLEVPLEAKWSSWPELGSLRPCSGPLQPLFWPRAAPGGSPNPTGHLLWRHVWLPRNPSHGFCLSLRM